MPTKHHLPSIRLAIAAATVAACLVSHAFAAPKMHHFGNRANAAPTGAASLTFLGKTYKLGSYNQNANPMWEFASAPETINKWSTLVTVVDRPDAASMTDLDRLAEGTLSSFKNRGAKVLLAKTMKGSDGKAYDYMVAAIDEPAKHRYELNFLKIAMGAKNAYILIYGARITDPVDYKARAAKYVDNNSRQIGMALDAAAAPAVSRWPRTTF